MKTEYFVRFPQLFAYENLCLIHHRNGRLEPTLPNVHTLYALQMFATATFVWKIVEFLECLMTFKKIKT